MVWELTILVHDERGLQTAVVVVDLPYLHHLVLILVPEERVLQPGVEVGRAELIAAPPASYLLF
jgi:hypothetical protein